MVLSDDFWTMVLPNDLPFRWNWRFFISFYFCLYRNSSYFGWRKIFRGKNQESDRDCAFEESVNFCSNQMRANTHFLYCQWPEILFQQKSTKITFLSLWFRRTKKKKRKIGSLSVLFFVENEKHDMGCADEQIEKIYNAFKNWNKLSAGVCSRFFKKITEISDIIYLGYAVSYFYTARAFTIIIWAVFLSQWLNDRVISDWVNKSDTESVSEWVREWDWQNE